MSIAIHSIGKSIKLKIVQKTAQNQTSNDSYYNRIQENNYMQALGFHLIFLFSVTYSFIKINSSAKRSDKKVSSDEIVEKYIFFQNCLESSEVSVAYSEEARLLSRLCF